jgi:hypothetical protein
MKKRVMSIAMSVVLLPLSLNNPNPVNAAGDVIVKTNSSVNVEGTVDVKYLDGRVEKSPSYWRGQIPTSITPIKTYQTCQYLSFSIEALLPYDQVSSYTEGVTIEFELWSKAGEKIASNYISSSNWNPLGGPTVIKWLECDDWLKSGSYSLIVKTEKTLSTNGLLSRYVEGSQVLPFKINRAAAKTTIVCSKGKRIKRVTDIKPKCPSGYKKRK